MEGLSTARQLVVRLLDRYQPAAQLADFIAEPPDHYTLRIDLPDEIGKTLILSRRLVEDALQKPAAHVALTQLETALMKTGPWGRPCSRRPAWSPALTRL